LRDFVTKSVQGDSLFLQERCVISEATSRRSGDARTPSRDRGVVVEGQDLAALVEAFSAHLRARGAAAATVRCRRQGLRPLREYLEKNKIADLRQLTRREVDAYVASLRERKLSPHTVESWIAAMRRFFDFLCETNRLLLSPAEHLRQHNLSHRVGPTLGVAEIERVLAAVNTSLPIGVRDRALIELLFSTGMRREEAALLTVFDVDLAGGVVRISHAKGGGERLVPLGQQALRWLRTYLESVRRKLSGAREGHALFVGRGGRALSGAGIASIVKHAGRRAGVSASCHTLRRTMATELLRGGANIAEVARL
jgi:integrase/recombinase XerD